MFQRYASEPASSTTGPRIAVGASSIAQLTDNALRAAPGTSPA